MLVKRLSEATQVKPDEEVTQGNAPDQDLSGRVLPAGVMVFRVFGAFFFGAADKLETSLRRAGQLPEVLILRMRDVLVIDATGLDALEDLHEKLQRDGKALILCGPHSQPMITLSRSGFLEMIGPDNICGDMENSLVRAQQILKAKAPKADS